MQPANHYQETGYHLPPAEGFGRALREARELAKPRLSQSKLAEAAGFDHSYISRLESGSRFPTVEAVGLITKALGLRKPEADALRMAAGFMPTDQSSVYLHPITGDLDRAMVSLPAELYQWVEQTVEAIIGHIERAQTSHD